MKKKNLAFGILLILAVVVLFTCRKEKDSHLFINGTKEIGEVFEISFPEGALTRAQEVTVELDADNHYQDAVEEIASFYDLTDKFEYDIRIQTEEQPTNDSIVVTFQLSDDYISGIPDGYGVELFALIYADGGEEIIDGFEIIESRFNSETGTVTATLPHYVFTDQRTEGVFEAVLTLAATPGISSNILKSGDDKCQAFGIICPVQSCDVSSEFNMNRVHPVTGVVKPHWGVDFRVAIGTNISSVSNGTVERISTDAHGYGLNIIIRHSNGAVTRYCHLSQVLVTNGQNIMQGEVIALSGGAPGDPNAGSSTGPHLHFEYAPNGNISRSKSRIDPMPCIQNAQDGAISIRDNGNIADDAFEAYLDGFFIGKTEIGASNTIALSGLSPGSKTLTITCIVAPDNIGTLEIVLNDGITFSSGGNYFSGTLAEQESRNFEIIIPSEKSTLQHNYNLRRPNSIIEK